MACNSYANCYIGCSCKTGWNKRSASASSVSDVSSLQTSGVKTASASGLSGNVSTMAAGDSCTVNITDPRYGTKCSISSTKDCAGVCDGSAYFYCASGSTSSYCPTGKYSVNVGTQKCSSGSATNSTSCYTCYNCTYSCPDGYSTSVSCSAGYEKESAYKVKDQNVSTCPSSYTLCYKCVEVSVDYYTTVVPSGKGNALKLVIKASGTVGKDYTVEYDGTATVSGGHTDGTEGTCDSMMRLISSCELSSGSSETSCVMYEAACETISWSGSLTLR